MSQSDTDPVLSEGQQPVSKRQQGAFLAAYVGAFLILIVPLASTLAIRVGEVAPDNRETVLGYVMALGAFAALIANPVFGALSDRTTSKFGRRRPYVVGGSVVGVVALLAIAFSSSVLVIGAAWIVTQIAMNAVLASLQAFIPDHVPETQRGKVSALAGIAQQATPFIGLLIANVALAIGLGTPGMFVVPSVIGLGLVMVYGFLAMDEAQSKEDLPEFSLRAFLGGFFMDPRKAPDFTWAWLGRFFVTLGFAFSITYMVYFMNTRLDVPLDEVPTYQLGITLITTILLAVSASVAGTLSDRWKKRKLFVFIATALIAAGSLITAFSHDWATYIVAIALTGIAQGAYFAVDLALVTDVLPSKKDAAKDLGIFNIANALPQSLAPAIAPVLLAIGAGQNYTALFIGAAVFAVIGALTVIPIKGVK